jgi:ribonuclease-3
MAATAKDPKTELQEWLQGRKMKLPIYRVAATWVLRTSRPSKWIVKSPSSACRERGIGARAVPVSKQAAAAACLR